MSTPTTEHGSLLNQLGGSLPVILGYNGYRPGDPKLLAARIVALS